MTDAELLQRYADDGSDAAFADLVERHLNLVYSVARRHVQSSQLAEDVAQSVFIELARHARRIKPGTPLVAWLHLVSRRTALNAARGEMRRHIRETAAAELATGDPSESTVMKTNSSAWTEVEPLLDEAVETLNATDRSAILLRFFENKSLREIGAALGISEDTAQKRVTRALDQLRTLLVRRGLTVTAAGLITDLSAHAIQTAPALLSANIAATAAASTALQLATSQVTSLTMTMLEKTTLTAGLVLTVGGVLFDANELRAQRAELTSLRQRTATLISDTRQAQSQRDEALHRTAEVRQRLAEQSANASDTPSDLALKAMMAAWVERVEKLRQLAADRPELAVPEIKMLTDEEWFKTARSIRTETETEIRQTLSLLRDTAEHKFMPKLRVALRAYLAANGGYLPGDSHQLLPFFSPPIDPAALDRYKRAASGKLSDLDAAARKKLIEQRSPVDWEEDFIWSIGTTMETPSPAFSEFAGEAVQAFIKANPGARPSTAAQLQPFLRSPANPARLEAFLKSP